MQREMKRKIGLVVGAATIGGEIANLRELVTDRKRKGIDCIIAADGGMNFFVAEGICPDLWIGDMDSAEDSLEEKVVEVFPQLERRTCSPIKDDTDLAIALNIIFEEEGCEEVYVYGGLGGSRMDHSIANIQLMHHYKESGKRVRMFGQNTEMFVLKNEDIQFDGNEEGYISVLSLTDESEVDIKGLFYEYSGLLKNSYALGVSNEFCGKEATICVKKGMVLVIKTDKTRQNIK